MDIEGLCAQGYMVERHPFQFFGVAVVSTSLAKLGFEMERRATPVQCTKHKAYQVFHKFLVYAI